ncbi:hypothetical protein GCM10023317_12380 [Actinopolymorpha pittospori]
MFVESVFCPEPCEFGRRHRDLAHDLLEYGICRPVGRELAQERLDRGDVRYRFVIDVSTLGASN